MGNDRRHGPVAHTRRASNAVRPRANQGRDRVTVRIAKYASPLNLRPQHLGIDEQDLTPDRMLHAPHHPQGNRQGCPGEQMGRQRDDALHGAAADKSTADLTFGAVDRVFCLHRHDHHGPAAGYKRTEYELHSGEIVVALRWRSVRPVSRPAPGARYVAHSERRIRQHHADSVVRCPGVSTSAADNDARPTGRGRSGWRRTCR